MSAKAASHVFAVAVELNIHYTYEDIVLIVSIFWPQVLPTYMSSTLYVCRAISPAVSPLNPCDASICYNIDVWQHHWLHAVVARR